MSNKGNIKSMRFNFGFASIHKESRCLYNPDAGHELYGSYSDETVKSSGGNSNLSQTTSCTSTSCGFSQEYPSYNLTDAQWVAMNMSGSDGHPTIQYSNPQVDANHNLYVADELNFDIYKYNGSSNTIAGTAPNSWYNSYYNLPFNSKFNQTNEFIYAIDPIGDVLASDGDGDADFFAANQFTYNSWSTGPLQLVVAAAFDTRPDMTIYTVTAGPASEVLDSNVIYGGYLYSNQDSLDQFNVYAASIIFENNAVTHNDYIVAVGTLGDAGLLNSTSGIFICDNLGNCNTNPIQRLVLPPLYSPETQFTAYLLTRNNSGNVFVYDQVGNSIYNVSPEQFTSIIQTNILSNTTLTSVLSLAWDSYTNSLIVAGNANGQAEVWRYSLKNNTWTNLNLNINSFAGAVAGVDGDLGIIYALDVAGKAAVSYQE